MTNKTEAINALEKAKSAISAVDFDKYTLIIWGAGNTSSLCQESLARHNIKPAFYIDGSTEKQNTLFYGNKVLPPSALDTVDNPLVLISSGNVPFTEQIKNTLHEKNVPNFTMDEYYFGNHCEDLISIIDKLEDERSVEVFCHMILCRLNNHFPYPEYVDKEQYFILPEFQGCNKGDVFVNLGAYKGEEIEKYVRYSKPENIGKIISFEPDQKNYDCMVELTRQLSKEFAIPLEKFENVLAAASDTTCTTTFDTGHESHSSINDKIEDAGTTIQVYALDDYLKGDRLDFLKADIESFELKMLQGAEKSIIKYRPKLAICIYHSPADMFDIVKYLESLDLGYKYSVRHHFEKFTETVLYAYH